MKNVLKSRIEFILLVLISIDFIYSGCCCKKKPSNDGSKTNSKEKSNQGSHGPDNPPIKPEIKPPVNPPIKPTDNPPIKPEIKPPVKRPVKPPVVKLTQEDIKSAILNCIDTNDDNRTEITEQWEVGICEDGAYIIKFGLFKFTVASSEVGKLTSPLTSEQVERLEGKIEMTRSDKSTNFTFSNDGKLKLGDLTKSLNLLDNSFRVNKTEHLYVKVTVDSNECYKYINLNNGLLYTVDDDYISRSDKNNKKGKLFYNYTIGPYYDGDGIWYNWDSNNSEYNKRISSTAGDLELFNTARYDKEDIDKFTLTVLSK